jgi:hypothetical protein
VVLASFQFDRNKQYSPVESALGFGMSWQSKGSVVWLWDLTWCWNPRCGAGRRQARSRGHTGRGSRPESRKLAENHGIKIQCLKLATNRANELVRVKGLQAQLYPRGWLGRRARVHVGEVACNWAAPGRACLSLDHATFSFRRHCARELAGVQTKPDFCHLKQRNFCSIPF